MGNCKSCTSSVKTKVSTHSEGTANGKMLLNNFGRCRKCIVLSSAICLISCYFYFVMMKFIPGHKMIEFFLLNIIGLFLLIFTIHVTTFVVRKISNK